MPNAQISGSDVCVHFEADPVRAGLDEPTEEQQTLRKWAMWHHAVRVGLFGGKIKLTPKEVARYSGVTPQAVYQALRYMDSLAEGVGDALASQRQGPPVGGALPSRLPRRVPARRETVATV